ncbi:rifin PIR protein, putative [Plasmodium reichenowi]|uniref:Rifin PIR protein, putative n=1 Tax=Plasmodium reichenowi TaxID=5854 RepID=A0A2P9DHE6_PLARE|nr:rifin PIR protein, putative [Plasmodium reichenowi]
MKLHYSNILLFVIRLNILVTSYHVNTHKKTYITLHHKQIYTSRVLSECDIQPSIYDNDAEIKSVKENFDRQTSQRFQEYEERMKDKRQKRKEERDKNIQKIIEKDKMEKSLAEKVEKGCLMCGCALGGVAASVGLFGGLGIYGSKTAAIAAARAEAMVEATAKGLAAGAEEGVKAVIAGIGTKFGVSIQGVQRFESLFTEKNDTIISLIIKSIEAEYHGSQCLPLSSRPVTVHPKPICTLAWEYSKGQRETVTLYNSIEIGVKPIVSEAQNAASVAEEKAIEDTIKISTDAVESTYVIGQNAIIASVVTILVIVLVMVIIYLVLRYRRKKKMKKKAQYTKLLNQ